MKRYQYRLQTLSCLALSPRDHQGYYRAAQEFRLEELNLSPHGDKFETAADKINIIYPFYQYGAYPGYDPDHTDYYIPGSSIKGAILANESKSVGERTKSRLMVDDISLRAEHLHLHRLYKVQNMAPESESAIELDEFFPNVAVEMLARDSEYVGEMFGDGEHIRGCLSRAQAATERKLTGYVELLKSPKTKDRKINENTYLKINNMVENIDKLLDEMKKGKSFTLLLGGFKGLALSREISNIDNAKSAIYVDHVEGSYLPHGLVRIIMEDA